MSNYSRMIKYSMPVTIRLNLVGFHSLWAQPDIVVSRQWKKDGNFADYSECAACYSKVRVLSRFIYYNAYYTFHEIVRPIVDVPAVHVPQTWWENALIGHIVELEATHEIREWHVRPQQTHVGSACCKQVEVVSHQRQRKKCQWHNLQGCKKIDLVSIWKHIRLRYASFLCLIQRLTVSWRAQDLQTERNGC